MTQAFAAALACVCLVAALLLLTTGGKAAGELDAWELASGAALLVLIVIAAVLTAI